MDRSGAGNPSGQTRTTVRCRRSGGSDPNKRAACSASILFARRS